MMLRGSRPIPRVCAKTILYKNGLYELFQAVEELAMTKAPFDGQHCLPTLLPDDPSLNRDAANLCDVPFHHAAGGQHHSGPGNRMVHYVSHCNPCEAIPTVLSFGRWRDYPGTGDKELSRWLRRKPRNVHIPLASAGQRRIATTAARTAK
jgi:hypothetical protein